jgi:uncharacterized protein YjbI with pentapeptide repeats
MSYVTCDYGQLFGAALTRIQACHTKITPTDLRTLQAQGANFSGSTIEICDIKKAQFIRALCKNAVLKKFINRSSASFSDVLSSDLGTNSSSEIFDVINKQNS